MSESEGEREERDLGGLDNEPKGLRFKKRIMSTEVKFKFLKIIVIS